MAKKYHQVQKKTKLPTFMTPTVIMNVSPHIIEIVKGRNGKKEKKTKNVGNVGKKKK